MHIYFAKHLQGQMLNILKPALLSKRKTSHTSGKRTGTCCFVILHTLQVCVLENVVGLWASVLMERDECGRSPHITFGVSLEKGAPVLLLFSLTGGDNDSFYESREMNARKGIFHIGHPIHGTENTENCQGKRRGVDCDIMLFEIQ